MAVSINQSTIYTAQRHQKVSNAPKLHVNIEQRRFLDNV